MRPTYMDLGVGLQGPGGKLGRIFIGGSDRLRGLRANLQAQLLAARRNTCDGLKTGFELGNGP